MGHIAEPKGIDFVIQSPPLTDNERKELSEFIKKRKAEIEKKNLTKRKSPPEEKASR
jgi:hypothetical protein